VKGTKGVENTGRQFVENFKVTRLSPSVPVMDNLERKKNKLVQSATVLCDVTTSYTTCRKIANDVHAAILSCHSHS
jgi:hypothetical protein